MIDHDDVARAAAELVRRHYVLPEAAERIAQELERPIALDDPDELAAELTRRAEAAGHDRHLRIRRRRATGPTDWRRHYAAEARTNAGGVAGVARIAAGTAVLTVAPYLSPVDLAEPYLRAAVRLLAGIERLVIDLRQGLGGTPETVAFLCGHLLGDEPVHLQDLVGRDGTTHQFWSVPAADRLDDDVRIAVLTSARTFSGCEELAYNLQALGRAIVVGERTAGGAHPVEMFELAPPLEITVPVERSVNAVTGTNWEGSGVVPDLDCPADTALERALDHMG